MSAATRSCTQVATIKPCISFSTKNFMSSKATFATKYEKSSPKRLATCFSTTKQLHGNFTSGKRAFIARVADGNRYGWAIAKSLAAAGVEIPIGPFVPQIDLVFHNKYVVWSVHGQNSTVQIGNDVLCLRFVDGGVNPRTSIVIGGRQLENNLLQFDLAHFKTWLRQLTTVRANHLFQLQPYI
ncbi:hypothetical protein WN943_004634 [Citrus x changshan-huyou]